MKASPKLKVLGRSTSAIAMAICLALPAAATAAPTEPASQAGTAAPTNAQPVDAPQPGQASTVQPTGQDPQAQQPDADIVVTGIRASLDRAIDIKRNSAGVVDAISAEDIGKFPDTNLAESLQRITGVSINRVNGEGSQVSVRGFSGGFNLVTLNGRQLPASSVDTSGSGDFARGTSRSFDFQNLASEGVSALEVYKTGRAAIPSGGIGAAINVVTRKPLDSRESGLSGSVGAKALHDISVNDGKGAKVLPEISGLVSWSDQDRKFGVSAFGSYQRRDSTSVQSAPNYFNVVSTTDFLTPGDYINQATRLGSRPTSQYVLIPNDSRYQFSENRRERINAQGVAQFRPTETLTFTADALFAQNKLREQRSEQTNWFNRPFNQVDFGGNPAIPTAVFLQRTDDGTKDYGYEQQLRATKTQLQSYGLNAKWEFADRLTLNVDGYHALSKSDPANPNGTSATLVSLGAPVGASQSVDFSSGFPVQTQVINDRIRGNGNGVLDLGDLGSQVARTITSSQRQRIDGGRADLGWDLGGGSRFDIGGNYTSTKMTSARTVTQQQLGDWGIGDPGIISRLAPSLVDTFCLTCKFDHFKPRSTGSALVAFRGNAVDLLNVLSPVYAANPVTTNALDFDEVGEKVWAVYGQITWKGEIADRPANLVFGARYEQTRTRSFARQVAPSAILWQSDNDYSTVLPSSLATATPVDLLQRGKYTNLLPSVDFNIEVVRNVIARASASRTLARPDYGNLFASTTVSGPTRPTALDGVGTGTSGNAGLKPLVSDNFDLSVEWYYKPSSFVSAGVFDKRVRNFIGSGVFNRNAFGLRDPSAGTPGSRSGTALARLPALGAIVNDVNLFSYTALLQQNGNNVAAADATYRANSTNGEFNAQFANDLLRAVDIVANAQDPLFDFAISQPINNQDGHIYGFELAGQHFFGDTGFGIAASYTKVNGDVNADVTADPNVNIFALTGLGDSANGSLIYDKNGLSARISYNWRAKFLSAVNQGDDKNPIFTDSFGTLDFNISYNVSDNLAVSLEGVNMTSEPLIQYGRDKTALVFAQELKPRILLGARYRF